MIFLLENFIKYTLTIRHLEYINVQEYNTAHLILILFNIFVRFKILQNYIIINLKAKASKTVDGYCITVQLQ